MYIAATCTTVGRTNQAAVVFAPRQQSIYQPSQRRTRGGVESARTRVNSQKLWRGLASEEAAMGRRSARSIGAAATLSLYVKDVNKVVEKGTTLGATSQSPVCLLPSLYIYKGFRHSA